MTRTTLKALGLGAALSFGAMAASAATECIAPANPGGGWDFTCRQIGKILFDIGQVDAPVQVTNMAGAGGGLAFSTVVNERNDDADLIVAASSATTTRLAQNAYGGATADQVRFVGAIGADPGVIVVAADSPFQSLERPGRCDQGRSRLGRLRGRLGCRWLRPPEAAADSEGRGLRRHHQDQVHRRRRWRGCDHPDHRRLYPGA